jgi:hypothetical protein
MLSWYANTFQISEGNITLSGLRRTRILAWLTLMVVPLDILSGGWIDATLPPALEWLAGILVFVSLVAFIALLFNPLVHRFWARDKYLDEWELDIKRKAMSVGYKTLFGILFLGLVYSSLTSDFSEGASGAVSVQRLDTVAFALLIFAFCVQVLTQLHLIRPIEGDDIEFSGPSRSPVWARVAVVFAILMLFFGPPFFQGLADGWHGVEIEGR